MALSFVDTDGTLVIPQANAQWQVAPSNTGLATRGVVVLVGEAKSGPAYDEADGLSGVTFGPGQYGAVASLFTDGNLVDAFRNVIAASKDPAIRGAPTQIVCLKTNIGAKASVAVGSYGVLQAKQAGRNGNLISFAVSEAVAEVPAAISAAFVEITAGSTVKLASNGGLTFTLTSTDIDPAAFVATNIAGAWAKGVGISGGVSFNPTFGIIGANVAVATSAGFVIIVSLTSGVWSTLPVVGDSVIIGAGSQIQGGGNQNRGSYIVTAVTAASMTLKKISELGGAAASQTAIVASAPLVPANFLSPVYSPVTFTNRTGTLRFDTTNPVAATMHWSGSWSGGVLTVQMLTSGDVVTPWLTAPHIGDLVALNKPVVGATAFYEVTAVDPVAGTASMVSLSEPVSNTHALWAPTAILAGEFAFYRPNISGLGKTLTAYRDPASVGQHFYTVIAGVASAAPMSVAGDFQVSAAEQRVSLNVARQSTNTSEVSVIGGDISLVIGKAGFTTAPVVVGPVNIQGGVGPDWIVRLSDFTTIGDLAAYISSQTNWTATVSAAYRPLPTSILDEGTYEANQNGVVFAYPARIKDDAHDIIVAIDGSSAIVEWIVDPVTGIPEAQNLQFLSGGAQGGTSNADVTAALAKAGLVQANFVVTLFSQDAAYDKLESGSQQTDAASTYDITSINAALSAHIAQFSAFKKRKPRQGFGSIRSTFSAAKAQAQNLGYFRMVMSFLDTSALGANGLVWFQPWMNAVLAAGMQAAAFYRPIFNKSVACFGVKQNAGDFQVQDDDAVELALQSGLLVMRPRDDGSLSFVSDQTTYSTDDNFVYNSIQAVYVADLIAMTTALRMERAFVGQSFADVTAGVALSYLKGIMADLKRLKLIVSSDDAVDGYKNAKIEIRPPSMLVSAEVKEATGIYFVPIKFLITQVTQTASQG